MLEQYEVSECGNENVSTGQPFGLLLYENVTFFELNIYIHTIYSLILVEGEKEEVFPRIPGGGPGDY